MPLFIMIINPTTYNTVMTIENFIYEETILKELYDYIDSNTREYKTYTIYKTYKNIIHFSINKYDSVANGLKGNYDDFYEYKHSNCIDEDCNRYIISTNEEKLRAFCGYINRLTC